MRRWRSCRRRSDRTPDGTTGYDDLSRSAERRIVAGIEVQLAAGRAKDFAALPELCRLAVSARRTVAP
jgi:hypothetical protein